MVGQGDGVIIERLVDGVEESGALPVAAADADEEEEGALSLEAVAVSSWTWAAVVVAHWEVLVDGYG